MERNLPLSIIMIFTCSAFGQNEIEIDPSRILVDNKMELISNTISILGGGTLHLNGFRGDVSILQNLAIGTSSPLTKLQIVGTTDASLTTHGLLMLGSRGSENIILDHNEIMARKNSSASTLFVNRDGGDVEFFGVGNGNLIIHGDLIVDDLPFGDYSNLQYGYEGKFYYDNSSRRYKENIIPLQDDWSKILQTRPVTYTRPGNPDRWEYGYIAEEIDSIGLTSMVGYDAEGNPEDVRYDKMILYLTEMIKLQQEQITGLQNEIKEQKAHFPARIRKKLAPK